MAYRKSNKASAYFKKPKPKLKPWEEQALETERKTQRLRALRLARDAEEREGGDAMVSAETPSRSES